MHSRARLLHTSSLGRRKGRQEWSHASAQLEYTRPVKSPRAHLGGGHEQLACWAKCKCSGERWQRACLRQLEGLVAWSARRAREEGGNTDVTTTADINQTTRGRPSVRQAACRIVHGCRRICTDGGRIDELCHLVPTWHVVIEGGWNAGVIQIHCVGIRPPSHSCTWLRAIPLSHVSHALVSAPHGQRQL
jgi:hypothetical protein